MKANVFEIKRFAVHDGDGIRTTVFLKGCPLKCVWCHNPEGISAKTQTAFYRHKCIGCGECQKPSFSPCDCIGEARIEYGKEVSVDDLLRILLEDKEFYDNSGGGVTLSGGECLMHPDFCRELLMKLKAHGVHTAIDTCGCVNRTALDKVIPYADLFLYDIKAFDEDVHVKCTGKSNKIILENLLYLNSVGKPIEIRIPLVPDCNDNQIEKISKFIAPLKQITKVRVLPYHDYAGSKYEALGIKNTLPKRLPTDTQMQKAKEIIEKSTHFTVIS